MVRTYSLYRWVTWDSKKIESIGKNDNIPRGELKVAIADSLMNLTAFIEKYSKLTFEVII